jgi:hypothetical protein
LSFLSSLSHHLSTSEIAPFKSQFYVYTF